MLPTTLTHNDIVYYNIKYPILSRGIAEIFCHFRKKAKDLSKSSRKVFNVTKRLAPLGQPKGAGKQVIRLKAHRHSRAEEVPSRGQADPRGERR